MLRKVWLLALCLVLGACGEVSEVTVDAGEGVGEDAGEPSCAAGEFLSCLDAETARVCKEDGSGVEEISCGHCSEELEACTECEPSTEQCVGDELVLCGDAGDVEQSTNCDLGCLDPGEADPRCGVLTPTNLTEDFCSQPVGNDEPIVGDIDTDEDCDTVIIQDEGPEICVLRRDDAYIPNGDIRVTGERALAIAATSSLVLEGRIDASAEGSTGGPAASELGIGETAGNDKGAGGGGYATGGAPGGTVDEAGAGGEGGDAYGNVELEPLRGGSRGGDIPAGNAANPLDHGGGGGAVQLVSCGELTISPQGKVHVGGGGGRGGGGSEGGGGGGGSGGAILVEAVSLQVQGILAANGGGGGAGSCPERADGRGLNGADADASEQPASGGGPCVIVLDPEDVSSTDSGGRGGAGGAAESAPSAGDETSFSDGGPGAGGGAAGRIRLNVGPGSTMDITNAVVSPDPSEGAVHVR